MPVPGPAARAAPQPAPGASFHLQITGTGGNSQHAGCHGVASKKGAGIVLMETGEREKQHHHKYCKNSSTEEKQWKQQEYNQGFCHQSGKQLSSPSLSLGYFLLLLNFVETCSLNWQGCLNERFRTFLFVILSFQLFSDFQDLGGTCVKVLVTYVKPEEALSCWTTNAGASEQPASETLFPSPTGSILFLWTLISEQSTWIDKQQVFSWGRIECRKESIYLLEIPFCRKSVCARKTEHMCWMNLGKTAPFLHCLWKITSTTPGLSLMLAFHQHFIKIQQIWKTNTKNKMTSYTELMVQHI